MKIDDSSSSSSSSQVFRVNPKWGAICRLCLHDLTVKARTAPTPSGQDSDGRVYCSNAACLHSTRPARTGSRLNRGGLMP